MSENNPYSLGEFYKRTEGKIGTWFTVLALAGAGVTAVWFWSIILPFLLLIATSTLYLAATVGVLVALGLLLTRQKTWLMVSMLYQLAWYHIVDKCIITLNPLMLLQNEIEELQERRQKFTEGEGDLKGQIQNTEKVIKDNNNMLERLLGAARVAQTEEGRKRADVNKDDLLGIADNIKELERSNAQLTDRLRKLCMLRDRLDEIRRLIDRRIQAKKFRYDIRKRDWELIQSGKKIFANAMAILEGNGDATVLAQRAEDYLDREESAMWGQFDQLIDETRVAVKTDKLDSFANLDALIERLQAKDVPGTETSKLRVDAASTKVPALPEPNPLSSLAAEEVDLEQKLRNLKR